MPAPSLADQEINCSFCGKSQSEVRRVIAGAGVHICNECVGLCAEILAQLDAAPQPADAPGAGARDGGMSDEEIVAAATSAQPQIPWPDTMTDEEILDFLPRIAVVSAQVDANLRVWVLRLRDRGVTWARIGAALGITRQSAWEKFSGEE